MTFDFLSSDTFVCSFVWHPLFWYSCVLVVFIFMSFMLIFCFTHIIMPSFCLLFYVFSSVRIYLHLSGSSKQHGVTEECKRYGCLRCVALQSWAWILLSKTYFCFYYISALYSIFHNSNSRLGLHKKKTGNQCEYLAPFHHSIIFCNWLIQCGRP